MTTEAILDAVVGAAAECGVVTVDRTGATTRLGTGGTEFATLQVRSGAVDVYLVLPGGHRLPGIVKLLTGGSDVTRHRLRLRSEDDVDAELRAWLCEAYRMAAST